MIRTDTSVRGFVVSLVGGILAATSIPLGLVFVVLGLVLSDQEAFLYVGLGLALTGLIEGGVALVWRHRVKAQDAADSPARISHTRARVLEAVQNPSSRVGTLNPMQLAVELGGGRQSRKLYVPPTTNWQPGTEIQVAYAPDNPGNFVPLE